MIILLVVMGLLLWMACSPGPFTAPPPPLRVATGTWLGYAPLHMARDLRLLDDREVHVQELPSGTRVITAFRNQTIDVAALSLDSVLMLLQDGIDLRLLLVMDVSHGADVVLGRPDLHALGDLKGHRVGVENTALGAYMLSRVLTHAGLSVTDITMVPLTYELQEQAYAAGRIDALVTFDPIRSRLLDQGAQVLFDSTRIPGEICDVLVVHADVLRDRRPQVQALLQAWFQALGHLTTDRADACRRIGRQQGLSPQAVGTALTGLQMPDAQEVRRLLGGAQPALLDPATRLARVMQDTHLLQRPVDPARLLDPTLGALLPGGP